MVKRKIHLLIAVVIAWTFALMFILGFGSYLFQQQKENYASVNNPNVSFRAFNNDSCAILTGDCIISLTSVFNTSNNVGLGNISYCFQSGYNPNYYHGLNITSPQFNNTVLNASFYSGSCQYYGQNPYAPIVIILLIIMVIAFMLAFGFFVLKNILIKK